jgi:hypothetical protein
MGPDAFETELQKIASCFLFRGLASQLRAHIFVFHAAGTDAKKKG